MDSHIPSKIEESINYQVDRIIPATDRTLNTILKLALLSEDTPEYQDKLQRILGNLSRNNNLEKIAVEQEFAMTYDCGGNLICINSKDEEDEGKEN